MTGKATFMVGSLVVALLCAWVSAVPGEIDGTALVGSSSCGCNWSKKDIYCATSDDAPPNQKCNTAKCRAGGEGSGTTTDHTYCTGASYCDEETGQTCSVGDDC